MALLDMILAVHPASDEEQLANSIRRHLARLLNARQGSLLHLPDYGLPDIQELYRGLPYSVSELLTSLKKTIEKFEPRLLDVDVSYAEVAEEMYVLRLRISGISCRNRMSFDTYFLSNGSARILWNEDTSLP